MNRALLRTLASIGLLAFQGCAHDTSYGHANQPREISFSIVTEAGARQFSGLDRPLRAIVRGQREWTDLWLRITAGAIPIQDPPAVDFSEHIVVVAAMGTRPTGGHSIAIERIVREGDDLIVEVVETEPGPMCIVTQALTSPVTAVIVERFPELTGHFIDRTSRLSCD